MIEMSPFYAHDSSVGPVFDVATWSRGKTWTMAVSALVIGVVITAAIVLAWKPTLLWGKPPEVVSSFHEETLKLQKEHPFAAYGGTALVALIGLLALAGSFASVVAGITGDYYFRAGPGGISFRVPHGLDLSKLGLAFKKLEWELPMAQIAQWTIVQHKQLGSMSRNTGNVMAFLKIRTVDGKREEFNLDCFREPAHVIHGKIDDALQMVPAQFGPADETPPARGASSQPSRTAEERFAVIMAALDELLVRRGNQSSVIFSDALRGKFVQFAAAGHVLLFDLPGRALDEKELARATEYFETVAKKSGIRYPARA